MRVGPGPTRIFLFGGKIIPAVFGFYFSLPRRVKTVPAPSVHSARSGRSDAAAPVRASFSGERTVNVFVNVPDFSQAAVTVCLPGAKLAGIFHVTVSVPAAFAFICGRVTVFECIVTVTFSCG